MIYARAIPEEVKVTETYEVDQVISVNPWRTRGKEHAGQIEITVPYDGLSYFTRKAARDVERARGGRPAADPNATIGHLLLAEHDQVESLPAGVRMRAEFGALPIAVPLLSAEELTAGRKSAVVTHEYKPKYPEIFPAELRIEVTDMEDLDYMSLAEELVATEEDEDPASYTKIIGRMRQKISFGSALVIWMRVHLSLPLNPEKHNKPPASPVVRRIAIDWPTITSLRTTELWVEGVLEKGGRQVEGSKWRKFPVRYNPVDRRLEWEVLIMGEAEQKKDGGDARTIDYVSPPMQLRIEHPGELYNTPELKVSAEIEIPGYLMSGLDPRLFSAFGEAVTKSRKTRQDPLPALTTRVTVNGTLVVDHAFAKRYFSPHHSIVWDDIIPDDMRITDIRNVLKSLGFSDIQDKPTETGNPDAPEWSLRAKRRRGPDQMDLWIYVEGTRHMLERKQIMGDDRVQTTGSKLSGQIRLHMLGRLPRDHQEMTREMNALQKALRDRYQYQMASRR